MSCLPGREQFDDQLMPTHGRRRPSKRKVKEYRGRLNRLAPQKSFDTLQLPQKFFDTLLQKILPNRCQKTFVGQFTNASRRHPRRQDIKILSKSVLRADRRLPKNNEV
jgi:hypothetical protein